MKKVITLTKQKSVDLKRIKLCTFIMCTEKYCPSVIKMILKYVGRNTLLIVAFHQITLQLVHRSGVMPNGSLIRISMLIILILTIEFVNRKYPQVLGRN